MSPGIRTDTNISAAPLALEEVLVEWREHKIWNQKDLVSNSFFTTNLLSDSEQLIELL